jgi:hypothetical protein
MKPTASQLVVAASRRLIAGGLLVGVAFAGQDKTPLVQPATGPNDVTFAQLEVGVDSPLKKSGIKVIKSADDWKDFLTKMNELDVKRPKVDWTKFQIVVATLEGSTNSGFTMHVSKVQSAKRGKTNIVFVLDQQPGNSLLINTTNSENYMGKTQYPYAIIQTPRIDTKWDIKVDE